MTGANGGSQRGAQRGGQRVRKGEDPEGGERSAFKGFVGPSGEDRSGTTSSSKSKGAEPPESQLWLGRRALLSPEVHWPGVLSVASPAPHLHATCLVLAGLGLDHAMIPAIEKKVYETLLPLVFRPEHPIPLSQFTQAACDALLPVLPVGSEGLSEHAFKSQWGRLNEFGELQGCCRAG